MEKTKKDWVIGISGTELDSISLFILKNKTAQEVKKYLASLVRDAKKEDKEKYGESTFETGTTSAKDIEGTNRLEAYACFTNYHINWTAQPIDKITIIED